jgi:hypothetical protein
MVLIRSQGCRKLFAVTGQTPGDSMHRPFGVDGTAYGCLFQTVSLAEGYAGPDSGSRLLPPLLLCRLPGVRLLRTVQAESYSASQGIKPDYQDPEGMFTAPHWLYGCLLVRNEYPAGRFDLSHR